LRVKHIAVQIAIACEKILMGITDPEYIKTSLQPADGGTKQQSGPIIEPAFNYLIGARHYPPPDSEHACLMDLSDFKCYHDKRVGIENVTEEKKDD
jgi:hypothetical protein